MLFLLAMEGTQSEYLPIESAVDVFHPNSRRGSYTTAAVLYWRWRGIESQDKQQGRRSVFTIEVEGVRPLPC